MRKATAILLVICLVTALAGTQASSQSPHTTPEEARFTPGAVWVKLLYAAGETSARSEKWQGYPVSDRLRHSAWVRLSVPQGREEWAAASLRQRSDVAWAEPEYHVHFAGAPNDPSFGSQWNMPKIDAPLAWDLSTGSDAAIVAVLDTGVDLNHADLQGNLWQNFGEVPGNGIDDDNNGYVDDRWGWDTYNDDANPQDDHGHGTHVAGIVGAVGNNGIGIAGMMWRCRIMSVKVLDRSGNGTYAGVADGAYYAAQNGARIINMSLAGSDHSKLLQDAITDLYLRYGVLFVAAAGNCANGGSGCGGINPVMYPAAMEHVVSVGATDTHDQRVAFSEYNAYVDLAAPGQRIHSLWVGGGSRDMSGTSMATPHVAGLAGIVRSLRPAWNPDMVEAHLKATADKVGGVAYDSSGRNDHFGYGRIDAAATLWLLDPPHLTVSPSQIVLRVEPGAPISVTVVLTSTSVGLADWSAAVVSESHWLSVKPASGKVSRSAEAELVISSPEPLASGLYRGQVRISSSHSFWDGESPELDVYLLVVGLERRAMLPVVSAGREAP